MSLFSHDSEYSDYEKRPYVYEGKRKLPYRCDKSFKIYKGERKPRCNGGTGCQTCWAIYALKHPDYEPQPTVMWGMWR